MQINDDNTTQGTEPHPATARHGALLGSTVIPELGLTFAEAGEKWNRLDAEAEQCYASNPDDLGVCDDLDRQRDEITKAILGTAPQTQQDAKVVLDLLSAIVPKLQREDGGEAVASAVVPVLEAVKSALSAAPAHLSPMWDLSPAIVTAYHRWRRAEAVRDFVQDLSDSLPKGSEEHEAVRAFTEAAGHTHFRIWENFQDTPAETVADRLLKVRVYVEVDDPDSLSSFRDTVRDGLMEVVRTVPFPAAPAASSRPATDDERRAFLTAHPDQIPHASPADLLRLLTPEEGAEIFAIVAGYLATKREAPDKLPQALATLHAYGEHADIGWELICQQRPYPAGMILNEGERADLARLGHLPEAAIGRLNEWTRQTEADLEEEREHGAAEDRAKRDAQERERRSPPLSELLQQALPDFTPEACDAAASVLTCAELLTTSRSRLVKRAETLRTSELLALAHLDTAVLSGRVEASAQETTRRELAALLKHDADSPDAELLAAEARYWHLKAAIDGWRGDEDPPDDLLDDYRRHGRVIATLPAFTIEGVAAKLRTFVGEIEDCGYSGILPEYIRTALEGAERASAMQRQQADQQPDAFADTVTGFTNEGAASLALPGAPTDAMVTAGAEAAGCSPEDLRRGYEAMVAAYAQERAA